MATSRSKRAPRKVGPRRKKRPAPVTLTPVQKVAVYVEALAARLPLRSGQLLRRALAELRRRYGP